jgi:ribose transport system permease protein
VASPWAQRIWRGVPKHQLGLLIAIVVIGGVWTDLTPYFLTTHNLPNIGQSIAVNAIIAAGVTVVMLNGTVDISMGGVVALTGMTAGLLAENHFGPVVAIAGGLVVAIACGLCNAALIVGIGVNPIVATLGTQFVFRGLAYLVNNGASSIVSDDTILFLGRGFILGLPFTVVLMFAVYLAVWVGLSTTRWGRHVFATGGNESAANRAGVRIRQIRTQGFVLSALLSGIGGLILAGQSGVAFPQAGFGSEFIILGSIIVGGTGLLGIARGGVGGTLLGVVLFGVIFNGFNLLGLNVFLQPVVEGGLLIAAVVIDDVRRRREVYV